MTLVEHGANLTLARHSHQEAVIGLLLRGTYDEWVDGREVLPTRASVLIKPPEPPHGNRIGREGTDTVLIQVHPEAIPPDLSPLLGQVAIHLNERVVGLGELLLRELRRSDAPSELGVEALVFELLDLALRRHPRGARGGPAARAGLVGSAISCTSIQSPDLA